MGEATETALTVLAEKMNVFNVDKAGLSKKEIGTVCNQEIQAMWKKDFTLEFSRDRKSMSCFCQSLKQSKLGSGSKMFLKVSSHGGMDRGTDGWMDGWTDGRTNGRTDERMDGQTVERTEGWTDGRAADGRADGRTDRRTDGRTDGLTDGRTDGQTHGRTHGRPNGRTDARTDARMDARTGGRTDGRTDGLTDGRTDGRTYERMRLGRSEPGRARDGNTVRHGARLRMSKDHWNNRLTLDWLILLMFLCCTMTSDHVAGLRMQFPGVVHV